MDIHSHEVSLSVFWVVVVPPHKASPPFFKFCFVVMPPHSWRTNYSRNAHRWCAVIRKPESAWLEGTPTMDLGHMNVVLKCMYLYVGSAFRMWNVVFMWSICMLILNVGIVIICSSMYYYYVVFWQCMWGVCLFVCWNKTRKLILHLLMGGKYTPWEWLHTGRGTNREVHTKDRGTTVWAHVLVNPWLTLYKLKQAGSHHWTYVSPIQDASSTTERRPPMPCITWNDVLKWFICVVVVNVRIVIICIMMYMLWFVLFFKFFVCLFVCWNKPRQTILRLLLGGK